MDDPVLPSRPVGTPGQSAQDLLDRLDAGDRLRDRHNRKAREEAIKKNIWLKLTIGPLSGLVAWVGEHTVVAFDRWLAGTVQEPPLPPPPSSPEDVRAQVRRSLQAAKKAPPTETSKL